MNSDQVRAVVSWMNAHPANAKKFYTGDCVNDILAFMSDPSMINEYENPKSQSMSGIPVENGCNHIFSHGSCMTLRCNQETIGSNSKCVFHDHIIFSDEIKNSVEKFKQDIRIACAGL